MQFEQLPQLFNSNFLPHIEFFELIRLCQTSKAWQTICNDRNTWLYLIKRDLINWEESTLEDELDFLEKHVIPENGNISPRDYYEYEYIVNSGTHFNLEYTPEINNLKKDYIINKLQKYSKTKPVEQQTWFFTTGDDEDSGVVISGFNKYDILRKYLINVVFRNDYEGNREPEPNEFTFFQDLEIALNYGENHPDIHTFPELFEFFANEYFIGYRIDNVPHY